MRQWLVDPKIMCRKHLLGEHVEHHMFASTIKRGISHDGYLNNNLLEPNSLEQRHEELSIEMISRGYNHKSPLPTIHKLKYGQDKKIDKVSALADLVKRCPDCKARYHLYYKNEQ